MKRVFSNFGTALVCAAMLLGSGSVAWADSPKDCAKRVSHAEKNLREAERKHGKHSHQAQERRRALEVARMKCGM
jgi:hypothetical protein